MGRKPTGKPNGRPRKEFNKRLFVDLVGMGCTQKEICWMFRDDNGVPVDDVTLTHWCQREFGMSYSDYADKNRFMAMKMKLRQNQLKLSEKSAAMAIFLGKNYLEQVDTQKIETNTNGQLADLIDGLREPEQSEEE